MNIVIQCAGRKRPDAGCMQRLDGTNVMFVADSAQAPRSALDSRQEYARPDDLADDGRSWRETLRDYNQAGAANPCRLLRAADLYAPPAYGELVERFGVDNVFILSAGWGLVRGSFLLPAYDITFNASAEHYKRRPRAAVWPDFNQLPGGTVGPTVFLGGKDYLPLFNFLSRDIPGRRVAFYNAAIAPDAPGCELHRYPTLARTNWHYQCAVDLARGRLDLLLVP